MLLNLSIKNFALIDEIDVQFQSGLNIITGETGSGKSIIIDALGLVMGDRADTTIAKDKTQKCFVEAVFDISSLKLKRFFEHNELDYEDKTTIRREINAQGKSRAFINDTPVTLQLVKELASKIIDIHSQHQTMDINNQLYQLQLVDALSNSAKELDLYSFQYSAFKSIEKELTKLKNEEKESTLELDYNTFLLSEFEGMDIENLNQKELEEELNVLENSEEISLKLSQSFSEIDDENGILNKLKEVKINLEKIENYNSNYAELLARVESSIIELKDISSEIDDFNQRIENNPKRLEDLSELLGKCYGLFKKHNVLSVEELVKIKEDLEEKILNVSSLGSKISAKEKELIQIKKELEANANELSKKRKATVPKIEKQIKALLTDMNMASAEVKIELSKKELSLDGIDDVLFYAKTNKGSEFKPLHQIASGGELSRIMLAIKSILSKFQKLPSIIFDEIDTGVSGEVADKVGVQMRKLSDNLQVFSITHLPQVASKGHQHFVVFKTETKNSTKTFIKHLSDEERVVEIAKMMSGEKITEASMQNAKELLKSVV